jgi:hypothetical protein
MVDPGEDFYGYMEKLAAAEHADQLHQQMLDAHEVSENWRLCVFLYYCYVIFKFENKYLLNESNISFLPSPPLN